MPSRDTFSILPIAALLDRYLKEGLVIVDPMARNSAFPRGGTLTNDIDPATTARFHFDALTFLAKAAERGVKADIVLLDPPYSHHQIDVSYTTAKNRKGLAAVSSYENPTFVAALRQAAHKILKVDGLAIVFGWNSNSMGMKDKYEWVEIMIVAHGGTRNDTIVTVQRKIVE